MTKTERLQEVLDILVDRGEGRGCNLCNVGGFCTDKKTVRFSELELWCDPCLMSELAGAKIADLEEAVETLTDLFYEGAGKVHEGPMLGWWDSCAKRSIKDAGDELVKLGLWERHPDGVGRRWFYRPIKKPECAL